MPFYVVTIVTQSNISWGKKEAHRFIVSAHSVVSARDLAEGAMQPDPTTVVTARNVVKLSSTEGVKMVLQERF